MELIILIMLYHVIAFVMIFKPAVVCRNIFRTQNTVFRE